MSSQNQPKNWTTLPHIHIYRNGNRYCDTDPAREEFLLYLFLCWRTFHLIQFNWLRKERVFSLISTPPFWWIDLKIRDKFPLMEIYFTFVWFDHCLGISRKVEWNGMYFYALCLIVMGGQISRYKHVYCRRLEEVMLI